MAFDVNVEIVRVETRTETTDLQCDRDPENTFGHFRTRELYKLR
jgi:hypothetical protein